MGIAIVIGTDPLSFEAELERKFESLKKIEKMTQVIDIKFSTSSVVKTLVTETLHRTYETQKIVTTYSALILYEK